MRHSLLSELFLLRGCLMYLRSNNVIATALRAWYRVLAVAPLFIEPGSPCENGYVEAFNGKLSDELLNGELFYTLHEAQVLVERWRQTYNAHRQHSALGASPTDPSSSYHHAHQFIGVTNSSGTLQLGADHWKGMRRETAL